MKLRSIETYLNTSTGEIPFGTYFVEGELKIGEVKWQKINGKKYAKINLLSRLIKGDTVNLQNHKSTIKYIIIYYSKLSVETNISLIKEYCYKLPKTQACEFWSTHSIVLSEILGDNFNTCLLQISFEIDRIPRQYEITYKGKTITKLSQYKREWLSNPKDFKLISYIKTKN